MLNSDVFAEELPATDLGPVLRMAIHEAEVGHLRTRLELPDGRRLAVEQIIRRFGLGRYVGGEA